MSERQHLIDPATGEVLAAWCGEPLDDAGQAAMRDLVAAAHRLMDAMPPDERAELERRQEASRVRIRERLNRLRTVPP